jgi:ATP-binding cassette subfamily C protein
MLGAVGARTTLAKLAILLCLFVALSITRAMILYARDMALGRLQTGFIEHLRNGLMRRLAAAPWSRIVTMRHARITSLTTVEINRVAGSAQYLIQGGVSLVMLVAQGALAVALAPQLAIATAAMVLAGGAIVLLAQGKIRDLGAGMVRANQAMMGSASGFLSGLKAAAAQNAQGDFMREFETIQAEMREGQLAFQRGQAANRRVFAIGSALLGALVIVAGVASGAPTAVLITVVLIFARMSAPALQLQTAAQNFFFALPSFEAVRAFEAELDVAAQESPGAALAPPPGAIEARNLGYLHAGGGGIERASFTLDQGSFTGVSGPSGAGKTTLVDLLITLLEPQTGELLVGGVPLDAARSAGWRTSLAYVPQEGFLFHDSVRRNLIWGAPDVDDDAMWRALALAGAEALVRRLPHGLDTVVGERGALLSGGERQRLAIARALIRQPRLLVLDEATNAIDAEGEAQLLTRLAALSPRPTIVMISHRAQSMACCDRVLVVERGRVSDGGAPISSPSLQLDTA